MTNPVCHNIVVRNKAADICEKYLRKGAKFYVEGRLKTRQWQGEDGNNRYTTEVHVQEFTFLSNKSDANQSANPMSNEPAQPMKTEADTSPSVEPMASAEEDDLPF